MDPEGETCGYSDSCYVDNYRPESSTYEFEYDYDTTIEDPADYYDASVTQLFYTANTYHDLLYELGFTEAAYNFQIDNEGNGGEADDYVILNAQDGAGTNNADFSTPPDGQPGRMRMYLWTESNPERDGSFEAGVILHEYTHGVSTRLTGGGSNSACLSGTESGGMGEGWGDFMATAIRLKETDTRETDYAMGAWVYNNEAGIREYLYSTDMDTNPLVFFSPFPLDTTLINPQVHLRRCQRHVRGPRHRYHLGYHAVRSPLEPRRQVRLQCRPEADL